MSSAHFLCESDASTLRPMILQFRFSNSGLSRAASPNSVVQTGVKSFGCENRTAHLSPIHSWKWIGPSVVSAVKSGAVSPNRIAIFLPLFLNRTVLLGVCQLTRLENIFSQGREFNLASIALIRQCANQCVYVAASVVKVRRDSQSVRPMGGNDVSLKQCLVQSFWRMMLVHASDDR